MGTISVEVGRPDASLAEPWQELARRAEPNVALHPDALLAASLTGFAKVHVLSAWRREDGRASLVGIWALQEKKLTPLGPALLEGPPYAYAPVANPMIDPELIGEVLPAFFAAIDAHPRLPKVLHLRYLDADCATYQPLLAALAARAGRLLTVSERDRPFAYRDRAVKRSGSTRKKLRQDWNRLCRHGTVAIDNSRRSEAVCEAFETFLALEAASWKGRRGTALLSNPADARFAREFLARLAARDMASVALLTIDGRAIAAQVVLYCGRLAYTWKTAFDAAYGAYSPGAQLVHKVTEALFATGTIDAIESCSPEGGFMARQWTGRRRTVDLVMDLARRPSVAFAMTALAELARKHLREGWHKVRARPLDRAEERAVKEATACASPPHPSPSVRLARRIQP